jgi:hypothetical protein
MPQGSEFAQGVLCEWETRLVGVDIEGEDAAFAAVLLLGALV